MVQVVGRILICLALVFSGTAGACSCADNCCSRLHRSDSQAIPSHGEHEGQIDGSSENSDSGTMHCDESGCAKGACENGCAFCRCSKNPQPTSNAVSLQTALERQTKDLDFFPCLTDGGKIWTVVTVENPCFFEHFRLSSNLPALPVYLFTHSILC